MAENERYSAAWPQFLLGRKAMLDEYDRAVTYAKSQQVQVHHGNVGESAFRTWLETFLPKRFGVTSGRIRSQGLPQGRLSSHFDVIIYNQLDSPVLWIDEDKAKLQKARIIPAEFVQAVLEVKSSFSIATVRDAISKLRELEPFMAGSDSESERYPKYFPNETFLSMVFFELKEMAQRDLKALELIRDSHSPLLSRFFYGPVILRGEGLHPNDTGLIKTMFSKARTPEVWTEKGFLQGMAMTKSIELLGQHLASMLSWSDVNFSTFAFELLGLLIYESALRDALLALAEQNKTQYLMLSAVVNELAALRETVRGLDPTFGDVLEREQKKAVDSTSEIVALQVEIFDSIIQRLKDAKFARVRRKPFLASM